MHKKKIWKEIANVVRCEYETEDNEKKTVESKISVRKDCLHDEEQMLVKTMQMTWLNALLASWAFNLRHTEIIEISTSFMFGFGFDVKH